MTKTLLTAALLTAACAFAQAGDIPRTVVFGQPPVSDWPPVNSDPARAGRSPEQIRRIHASLRRLSSALERASLNVSGVYTRDVQGWRGQGRSAVEYVRHAKGSTISWRVSWMKASVDSCMLAMEYEISSMSGAARDKVGLDYGGMTPEDAARAQVVKRDDCRAFPGKSGSSNRYDLDLHGVDVDAVFVRFPDVTTPHSSYCLPVRNALVAQEVAGAVRDLVGACVK